MESFGAGAAFENGSIDGKDLLAGDPTSDFQTATGTLRVWETVLVDC